MKLAVAVTAEAVITFVKLAEAVTSRAEIIVCKADSSSNKQ